MNIEHANHRGRTRSSTTLAAVVAATVSVALLASCTSARSGTATAVSSGVGASAGASTLPGEATTATATSATTAAQTTTNPPITTTTTTIAPPTTTTIPAPTTTTIPAPTTTTVPLVTEGAVVLVANASNVPGGAGKLASALAAVGFHMAPSTNAGGNEERLDVTKIYFLPGGEAVAQSLAMVMGSVAVTRMPVPAPITGANVNLADATVLIMLGKDLAGKKIPGLQGR